MSSHTDRAVALKWAAGHVKAALDAKRKRAASFAGAERLVVKGSGLTAPTDIGREKSLKSTLSKSHAMPYRKLHGDKGALLKYIDFCAEAHRKLNIA